MFGKRMPMWAGVVAIALVAAACSSSSKSGSPSASSSSSSSSSSASSLSSGSGASAGHTITIGVLTDVSGLAASTEASVPEGIKAGVGEASQEGYTIKYVIADAGTSPTGALTAVQKLVDQDHVFGVIAISAVAFAAASFLTAHNIPVVGADIDGPEWVTAKNMFSIDGTEDFTKVYDVAGKFYKMEGVTNLAALGYGITPSSALSTKDTAVSAEVAGIRVGYLNANFPFGSTNVGPVALAIKSAGSDGMYTGVETSTSFALITALEQDGVHMKAALLPIGYGGDLLSGGPAAEQAAQGVYFIVDYEPAEMHTGATEQFQRALKQYAGVTDDPTFNEYLAYVSVDGFVTGLKAAGPDPTQAGFINAMSGITDYNAAGLFGDHSISFALSARGQTIGADNCEWITQFSGSTFHLVPGADPVCGSLVPGKTVS
jgi:branched-chain amino acid transport system substrate-binding protein